jgi:hypothetical protein
MLSFSCKSIEKGHLRAVNSLWPGITIPGPNMACLQSLGIHDINILLVFLGKLILMSPTGHGVISRFGFFGVLRYLGE